MACISPTDAWQDLFETTKNGKHPVIFSFKQLDPAHYFFRYDRDTNDHIFVSDRYKGIHLPCGKCLLCRKARAWEITVRALLELQSNSLQSSCFLTLTCSDQNLPSVFPGGLLQHRPWQLFAKKLRKKIGPFRFLMCGEYGEQTHRPHYHAIIFGHDLTDREWNTDGTFCDSPLVRDTWQHGQITCRKVNDNAIAYVAGYELKLTGDELLPDSDPEFIGPQLPFKKGYVKWSRNPGLGYDFMFKHKLFRENLVKCHDGTPVSGFSPSVIYRGKQIFFDGRYFKKQLEKAHDQWSNFDDLLDPPDTPLTWSSDYDKLLMFSDRRAMTEQAHQTSEGLRINAMNLKNKEELFKLQLARKLRDVNQA